MYKDKKEKIIAILLVLLGFLLYSLIFKSCDKPQDNSQSYKDNIDSLHRTIDSLQSQIKKEDSVISQLRLRESEYDKNIVKLKKQIKDLRIEQDKNKNKIDSFNNDEIVAYFNNRYPEDTNSNKIELAKPVLVSTAKDLVELDISKQIIDIKDSIISQDSIKLISKDSVINSYDKKEKYYKDQMSSFLGIENNYRKIIDNYEYDKKKQKKKLVSQKLKTWAAVGLFVTYIFVRK